MMVIGAAQDWAGTLHDWRAPLAAAGVLGAAVWVVVVWLAARATRPRRAHPEPAGLELGGDEPPAVATMLTHGFRPRRAGAGATLLDLAARKVLTLEPAPAGGLQVRLPGARPAAAFTPYEQQVLDFVESKARGGVVPCAALAFENDTKADRWFKSFDQAVVADARQRGLSRKRFSAAALTGLTVVSAAAAIVIGAGIAAQFLRAGQAHHNSGSGRSDLSDADAILLGPMFVCWIALLWCVRRIAAGDRDTPAGHEHAGRWLGLRQNLHADPTFCDQPAQGIAIWDRLLAFGVALGVAHRAAHELPMGTESKHEAWSAETGQWRVVHVRYPNRIPPGWGQATWRSLLYGLLGVAAAIVVLVVAVPAIARIAPTLQESLAQGKQAQAWYVRDGLQLAAGLVAIAAVLFGVWMAWMLVLAIADLGGARTVEGVILRLPRHHYSSGPGYGVTPPDYYQMAVDDGTADHVRAWRLGGDPGEGEVEGARVRVRVTRHLGNVRKVTVLAATPPRPVAPGGAGPAPSPSGPPSDAPVT